MASGCALAQNAAVPETPTSRLTNRPDIGVGLEGLADWSRSFMFADAMKTSRRWGNPERPWEHTVKTDALGWPTEDAGVIVIADTPNIDGTYALSFEGKAEVRGHFKSRVENVRFNTASNLSTARVVVPEGETQLFLSFTNTQNGVRNVRLLRPGADPKSTFFQPFLKKVAPFSTLRFMDFLATNNNPVRTWEERTTPAHASQAREQGGALEYVVELANVADKDVWVNVPDQADENYIRQMAQLLKDGLEPERKVYVEWSNEVWNWQFRQATRNLEAAKVEGKKANSPLAFDQDQNEGYWAMRRIAQRSVEVGKTFRDVFGDQNFERVRPVYATQVGYEEVYRQGLAFVENQYKQPNKVLYGLAGAPYFQVSDEMNKKKDLTVDEIFAAIPADIKKNLDFASNMASYAHYYGLKTLAYEGGQHLQDQGDVGNAEAKIAANRDPRMGQAIATYLRGWNALGGDLFMYFTLTSGYSKWGSWGLVEDVAKTSPKYDAVLRVLEQPKAPLTMGVGVPGELRAGDFIATSHWDKPGGDAVSIEPNKWFQYAVRAPKAGNYTVSSKTSGGDAAKASLWVNAALGAKLGIVPGGETATVSIPLQAGLNVLRIRGESGRFNLKSLDIAAL